MCEAGIVPTVGTPGPPGTLSTESSPPVGSPPDTGAGKFPPAPAAGWSNPGSLKVNTKPMDDPSSVLASATGSAVGGTFITVTVVVYVIEPPASSATARATPYVPSSPYMKEELSE